MINYSPLPPPLHKQGWRTSSTALKWINVKSLSEIQVLYSWQNSVQIKAGYISNIRLYVYICIWRFQSRHNDSHQWCLHTLLSTQTLNAKTNSHLLYLIFSLWPIKSYIGHLQWNIHRILIPNHTPKWQVESLQWWYEEKKMRKTPESCSVSLKSWTQRETCSDQTIAGFSVSDAFRLLDQKEKVQIKHENSFTGDCAHSWGGWGGWDCFKMSPQILADLHPAS